MDGMSSFGVKTPLRRAIIAQDFYWEKAAELVKKFHDKGMASETRIYKELTEVQMTAHVQCTPLPIKGCMKFHMIVFKPDGNILSKEDISDCANCLIGGS